MAKIARNAFKGYTYQQYIFFLMVTKMDCDRKIDFIEEESIVKHNFDDLNVRVQDACYDIQVKNYPDLITEDITVDKISIFIKGNRSKLSKNTNIVIVNTDKIQCNNTILDLDAFLTEGVYIVPLTPSMVREIIEEMYETSSRVVSIMNFCYQISCGTNYVIKQNDLPEVVRFSVELDDKTILIRDTPNEFSQGVTWISGKPGVGKSHYVNELIESVPGAIVYRFWTNSQDPNLQVRLRFEEFIADISYAIFQNPRKHTYQEIIDYINQNEVCLILDGMDHVENYNPLDLEKYMTFLKDVNQGRIMVLSRPLNFKIQYPVQELDDWTMDQTLEYLARVYSITDYIMGRKLYLKSQGYPIIVCFLAEQLLLQGNFDDEDEKILGVYEYYNTLFKDVRTKTALGIFIINNSFFLLEEIELIIRDDFTYNVIKEFIESYPFLFKRHKNRIALIHDSLNTYLKNNNFDNTGIKNKILSIVEESIRKGEIRFLSRIERFCFNEEFIIEIIKKYSDLKQFKKIAYSNLDSDSVREFYQGLKRLLERRTDILDVYQYYSFVLIMLIVDRSDYIGSGELLLQVFKYLNSTEDWDKDIYSSGVLWGVGCCIHNNDISFYKSYLNEAHYDIDYEIQDIADAKDKDENFFKILNEESRGKLILQKLTNDRITELDKKDLLRDYLIDMWIHNGLYKDEIGTYVLKNDETLAANVTRKLCRQYDVREFWTKNILKNVKYRLWELGVVRKENPLLNSLSDLIEVFACEGSFTVNQYIVSYIRLARFENRIIDIKSISRYAFMYYNRKDYSVTSLSAVLKILEEENGFQELETVKILKNVMEQSEKGIRHILYEYINNKDIDFINRLLENPNYRNEFPVDIMDLNKDRINLFNKDKIIYRISELMERHYYSRSIDYYEIENMLDSKYQKLILDAIEYYDYEVISVPEGKANKLKSVRYAVKKNEEKELKEPRIPLGGGYIQKNDFEYIVENKLDVIEASKFLDGWHACFPYVELYEEYDKKQVKEIYLKIIHTALYSKHSGFEFTGNWYKCVGNIPKFLKYLKVDVAWGKIQEILFDFIDVSMIPIR
jgi:hypothetical protein